MLHPQLNKAPIQLLYWILSPERWGEAHLQDIMAEDMMTYIYKYGGKREVVPAFNIRLGSHLNDPNNTQFYVYK